MTATNHQADPGADRAPFLTAAGRAAVDRAPLWVARYEAARAAEQLPPEILANAAAYNAMIGDGHTGRVRPWTRADVIA